MAYEIKNKKNISTIGVHAGQEEVDETGSRVTPIYQTTSYVFDSPEQAANRFALTEAGNIYTRLTNPTTEAFEKRMAAIEGGTAAYATASGMAAIFYAIINLTQVGDNIVSADNLYGGTYELFENTLEELGRTVTFVDSQSPELFEKAIDDRTRAIYVESIGNPKLDIPDFDKLAESLSDKLLPVLTEIKNVMSTVPEKLDIGFQSTAASIGATNAAPTKENYEAQIKRENPNLSKEDVDLIVRSRLNERAKADANGVAAKIDELMSLLKGFSGSNVVVKTI